MYKENMNKHDAILKAAEIMNYYEGKVQHQHKAIQSSINEMVQLTIPREQFLQNMFTYFKNAVHNSKPAQEYLRQRGLDPLKIEVVYTPVHGGSSSLLVKVF